MADSRDVVGRADFLMQRRRSFVAKNPAGGAPLAPLTASVAEDPDAGIPVLTEVIPPEASVAETGLDRFDETLISILAADLAHSIEARLACELPALVNATLRNLEQELHQGVVAATESALRDFLEHRKKLRGTAETPSPEQGS